MRKKIAAGLLCLLFAAGGLCGCQPAEESSSLAEESLAESPAPQAEAVSIGLVQFEETDGLNTLREAFMGRLEEWGCGEDVVEVDYQNAGGDSARAGEICQAFAAGDVDLIVAIDAPAAQAAVDQAQESGVTVVFAGVGDEKALGLAAGDPVTGVVSPTPVESVLDMAQAAGPQLKTLGLLYDPQQAGSQADADRAKAWCEDRGVAVVESPVESGEAVEAAMTDLVGKVDAVFTPADSTVASQAGAAAAAAKAAGKPWYTGSCAMVEDGALASMGWTSDAVGRKAADLAVELLLGGDLAKAPVYTFQNPRTFVNQTTLSALEGVALSTEAAYLFQDREEE